MAKPNPPQKPAAPPPPAPKPEAELVTCIGLVRNAKGLTTVVEVTVPVDKLRTVGTAGDIGPVRQAFQREVAKRYIMQPPLKVSL